MLARVDVIQNTIGTQGLETVFGAGDIGSGVQVTAIFLLDDDTHRIAVFIFVLVQEHHGSAFAFYRQPFRLEIGNDARQHGVVQAFAHDVIFGQGDIQTVIGQLVLRHGDVHQLAPHLQTVFVAALQFDHVTTGAKSEIFVFVVVFLGFAVKLLQIRQPHIAGVLVLHLFQVGDQHAELGTPVAHMVGAYDFMAQEFLSTGSGIANNGGAQVTHVHFFRHVGRRIVDHDGLRLNGGNSQLSCAQGGIGLAGNPFAVQEDIDKARAGNFHFAADVTQVQQLHDFLCQLSWRHTKIFGNGHHAVGLIVTKLCFRGLTNLSFAIGRCTCGNQRLADLI
ncbi:hypothetical protein D3C73_448690 [compost metagenome]